MNQRSKTQIPFWLSQHLHTEFLSLNMNKTKTVEFERLQFVKKQSKHTVVCGMSRSKNILLILFYAQCFFTPQFPSCFHCFYAITILDPQNQHLFFYIYIFLKGILLYWYHGVTRLVQMGGMVGHPLQSRRISAYLKYLQWISKICTTTEISLRVASPSLFFWGTSFLRLANPLSIICLWGVSLNLMAEK